MDTKLTVQIVAGILLSYLLIKSFDGVDLNQLLVLGAIGFGVWLIVMVRRAKALHKKEEGQYEQTRIDK